MEMWGWAGPGDRVAVSSVDSVLQAGGGRQLG